MKIKSIPKAAQAIREHDPDTAVNENMLYALIKAGKLPFDMHGSRMVVDLDTVTRLLKCLLDMENLSVFPRIRSIHDAFVILKEEQPNIGIGEPQIRELIRLDKLRSIEIGNRHYIAPESFTPPYCYRLSDCATPPPRRTPPYRRDAMAQFNELMAKNQHLQTMSKR